MNAILGGITQVNGQSRSVAAVKLFWLAQGLRVLSASYAVWVLLRVVRWWTDSEKSHQEHGVYLGRDLSALTASPRIIAMALDLGAWLLLLAAVVCCWKSLGILIPRAHLHPTDGAPAGLGWLVGGAVPRADAADAAIADLPDDGAFARRRTGFQVGVLPA